MYVLARSNLTEMLLNVEYMMELMDPALQLGEGESLLEPGGPITHPRPSHPRGSLGGPISISWRPDATEPWWSSQTSRHQSLGQ